MLTAFRLIGILTTIFCVANANLFVAPFWSLPFFFTLYMYLFISKGDIKGPGIITLHVSMIGRYILVPASYYITGQMSQMAKDYSFMSEAIWLMLYEQFCVFLIMFYTRHYGEKYKAKKNRSLYCQLEYSNILLLFAVILWLVIAASYKSLGNNFSILLSGAVYKYRENDVVSDSGSTFISMLWQTLCVWLFVIIATKEQRSYLKDGNIGHALSTAFYALLLIVITFIDQSGLSRWYTIITACSCVAFLAHLFPQNRKSIVSIIAIPSVAIVLLATAVKNGGYLQEDNDFQSSTSSVFNPTSLDVYFSGPTNINNSIGMLESLEADITNFPNDILNNFPVVNHYVSKSDATVYKYNLYLGRLYERESGDQIIPLVGQGLAYFGLILSPLLSILSILLIRYFDLKYKKCNDYFAYLFAFISIWFGVEAMALNMTINISWFYWRIIPFAISFYFTNRLAKKQQKHAQNLSYI